VKIDFEGVTRVLDLEHVRLRSAIVIQEFTGLPVFAWQERLTGIDLSAVGGFEADPVGTLKKMPMFTDPGWIMSVAAAHWLMLTQNGEEPPPLDDDYDCDVLGFYLAFLDAVKEEARAKRVPDKPDPKAPPGRPARSSRRTKSPASVPPLLSLPPSGPLPRTGS
jgi:hypothetical protein